jgi:hypothetical protein
MHAREEQALYAPNVRRIGPQGCYLPPERENLSVIVTQTETGPSFM